MLLASDDVFFRSWRVAHLIISIMAKRWTAECDDVATLAKAIFPGVVTDSKDSFEQFFGPGGPAESIGEKYHFGTVKGKRNL